MVSLLLELPTVPMPHNITINHMDVLVGETAALLQQNIGTHVCRKTMQIVHYSGLCIVISIYVTRDVHSGDSNIRNRIVEEQKKTSRYCHHSKWLLKMRLLF